MGGPSLASVIEKKQHLKSEGAIKIDPCVYQGIHS